MASAIQSVKSSPLFSPQAPQNPNLQILSSTSYPTATPLPPLPLSNWRMPSWAQTVTQIFPTQSIRNEPIQYGSVVLAFGILALGLGVYYYLNSQGIRPDVTARLQPIPLTAP